MRGVGRYLAGMALALVAIVLAGCSNETYESGDGKYSYLQAHYVEARTNHEGRFVSVVTDEGKALRLRPFLSPRRAVTPDSVYRALFYHNKVEADGTTEPVSITQVPIVRLRKVGKGESVATDPVSFESAWVSPNGKYLNIAFGLKTGKVDDENAVQTIGLLLGKAVTALDGSAELYIQFSHEQNDVPQYYTVHHVISMPLEGFRGTIHLSVNSYKGLVNKVLTVSSL